MLKIILSFCGTVIIGSVILVIYALCKISADADKRAGYDLEGVE